ncbi:MMPL family transporter [Aquipuribacter hungaricus]|uniref:MMPL family transporter n=1 Tax=Aquipuribacter hungaricus TaxID=545624 RepID=A0ABV7WI74_9MICO
MEDRSLPHAGGRGTLLASLGRLVARHRWVVLAVWALVTVVGGVVGGSVFDRTETVDSLRPGAESSVVAARLAEVEPEPATVVALLGGTDFFDPVLVDSATAVAYALREVTGVVEITDAYTAGGLAAPDGQRSLVVVDIDPALDDDAALEVADRVTALLRGVGAPEVLVGGELLAERAFADQAVSDAVRGESVAVALVLVVLVLVLGGLRAALLPVVTALAVICGALLVLTATTAVLPVSEFAVNIVTLLGLGLAVDYGLLVVSRFREERDADPGADVVELVARTTAAAGRAVVLSGLAVGVAFAGLLAVGEPLLAAMALGGVAVAALVTLAGVTLVPALVAVGHRWVPAPGSRTWVWRRGRTVRRAGLLERLAVASQRRPLLATVAGVAVLGLACVPLLSLDLGTSDARSLPPEAEARQVAEVLEQDFRLAAVQPLEVLVGTTDPAAVEAVRTQVWELGGIEEVRPADAPPEGTTVLQVVPAGTSADAAAQRLVRQVRALPTDVPVQVGGAAAELVDTRDGILDRLPLAAAVVVVPTLLLLGALTRSVVVPVKAVLLDLLTLGATLGVVVLVFQDGVGAGLLGFEPLGTVDVTTPLLLFVLVFALSMDYEVFLLARISEAWQADPGRASAAGARAANARAVLAGITASGPVVTAAAVCIGLVFLGFALGELVAVKEVGVGMALAVLLDVTLVRGVLLPATMTLLGRWNWWPGARA